MADLNNLSEKKAPNAAKKRTIDPLKPPILPTQSRIPTADLTYTLLTLSSLIFITNHSYELPDV